MTTTSTSTSETSPPTEADGIRIELSESVLRVTMARSATRNSQTPAVWSRLREARDLAESQQPQVVVVSGEGQSFSAGLDTRMFTPDGVPGEESLFSLAQGQDEQIQSEIATFQDAFSWLSHGPAITVAAVQGHAIGAGFQLALNCDFVICAEDARFSMKEAAYGLVPDLTGTSPLVRAVGYRRALDICVTTRWVLADEALALGLATEVVRNDDLADRVDQLVATLRQTVPGVAGEIKALLAHGQTATPTEQYAAERSAQVRRLRALAALMQG